MSCFHLPTEASLDWSSKSSSVNDFFSSLYAVLVDIASMASHHSMRCSRPLVLVIELILSPHHSDVNILLMPPIASLSLLILGVGSTVPSLIVFWDSGALHFYLTALIIACSEVALIVSTFLKRPSPWTSSLGLCSGSTVTPI